jgi:type I restriction enzyme S subunit
MKLYEIIPLGRVCRIEAGSGFPLDYQGVSGEQYPFFKVGDMNNPNNEKYMEVCQNTISEETRKKLKAMAFFKGTIIFPKIGAAIATNKKRIITRPSCVDNNVMSLIPNETKITSQFLFYLLLQTDLQKFANRGNPPSIRQTTIEDWEISLPPLPKQHRIATILQKADRIRRLRRYARQLSDGYLQSVFLEMFGDPVTNPKNWQLTQFNKACESRLGKMLDEKRQTGMSKHKYLRNFNVQWFYFDLSNMAEMDFDEKDQLEFQLKYGDVLICEGGEVGRTAIWRNEIKDCYFQKALHRVRPNPNLVNSEYIMYLMWWMAKNGGLGDFTSQVTIAHLTGEKLKGLIIPIPPMSIQNEFKDIVKQYSFLSQKQIESERQSEMLFQSLLHQAFQGEL